MSINLSIAELADCSCKEGKLLPVEDVTKEGQNYLKGWFCPACKAFFCFSMGDLTIRTVRPWIEKQQERDRY